jgi:hypothetical protein
MRRRRMSPPLIVVRIVVLLGIGFSAAFGILYLVAGSWGEGLISLVVTLSFLSSMFLVERRAKRG